MMLIIYNCFGSGSGTDVLYDTYDKGPFYAFFFSVALIILFVGYYKKRKFKSVNVPVLDSSYGLQQYDILGQPQKILPISFSIDKNK